MLTQERMREILLDEMGLDHSTILTTYDDVAHEAALSAMTRAVQEAVEEHGVLSAIATANFNAVRHDPNVIGETLRAWAFTGDGYGCYSTFEVRKEFVKTNATPREFAFLWGREFDRNDTVPDDNWEDCDAEAIKRISWFKHPNGIEMGWHWDGDGFLAFFVPELITMTCNGVIRNGDCKHDDEWRFSAIRSLAPKE